MCCFSTSSSPFLSSSQLKGKRHKSSCWQASCSGVFEQCSGSLPFSLSSLLAGGLISAPAIAGHSPYTIHYLTAPFTLCLPNYTSILCCCNDSISPQAHPCPSGINKVNLTSPYLILPRIPASLKHTEAFAIWGLHKSRPMAQKWVAGLVLLGPHVGGVAVCFKKSASRTLTEYISHLGLFKIPGIMGF